MSVKTKEDPALAAIEARNKRNDLDAIQKDTTSQTAALARYGSTPAAGSMTPPILWGAPGSADGFQNLLMRSMLRGKS